MINRVSYYFNNYLVINYKLNSLYILLNYHGVDFNRSITIDIY